MGLYCITKEDSSNGRSDQMVVLEMVKNGVKIIQYRDKDKKIRDKVKVCREIRQITADYGVLLIVNDNIELALLTDADGVHLGQDDMDISDARKILGDRIIGVSTHSSEDGARAINDGADYIGVGPIFQTPTKPGKRPVGFEYLDYAVKTFSIPFIAIGGINESNLVKIIDHGAKRFCMVSDVTESENIGEKIRRINDIYINRSVRDV